MTGITWPFMLGASLSIGGDMQETPTHRIALFRFYQELNDFLPPRHRGRTFETGFVGEPAIKDTIEAIGVPHPEIELILVDGRSVGFDYQLKGGERVAVYPVFERFDIAPLLRLRPRPLRNPRFIVDVNLGKLARHLRLLGFDVYYQRQLDDPDLVQRARREHRIILTRDKGVLKYRTVTHGYWVRNTCPKAQRQEVIRALQLQGHIKPFSRCSRCNGLLDEIAAEQLASRLDPALLQRTPRFWQCVQCRQLYWCGSHVQRFLAEIARDMRPDE